MQDTPTRDQLEARMDHLFSALREKDPKFDTALILSKVSLYYLTGTMQEGLLVLRQSSGKAVFYVRKSYDRACAESPFADIRPMASYRQLREDLPQDLGTVYLETQAMPLATLQRLQKYFTLGSLQAIDPILIALRARKDAGEIEILKKAGHLHQQLMDTIIPSLLREGMSETDFFADLYREMIRLGYQGISRFAMFEMEMVAGQMGFGENSLAPTNFDGPGGMQGMHPAMPIIGDRSRKLKEGDLVFVDIAFGLHGYHSDKTQVYSFKAKPAPKVLAAHQACREILKNLCSCLRAGAIPETVYQEIMAKVPTEIEPYFMGHGGERVRFLGHGVGLQVDEAPIIAQRQKEPLHEGMVIALEPKCGLPGRGMVGVEETYLVTDTGLQCLTGGDRDIIVVGI